MNITPNLCGIDEAGRGPLAGPMAVAGCILRCGIQGLHDSKKLSESKREALFDLIIRNSTYHVVLVDAHVIDEKGISRALSDSIEEIVHTLQADSYLMDGNTNFGILGLNTLIKADGKIPEVSAASILAKVSRDRKLLKQAKEYPQYGFESHKGYGTKAHIEAIKKHGFCPLHRRSYKVKGLE